MKFGVKIWSSIRRLFGNPVTHRCLIHLRSILDLPRFWIMSQNSHGQLSKFKREWGSPPLDFFALLPNLAKQIARPLKCTSTFVRKSHFKSKIYDCCKFRTGISVTCVDSKTCLIPIDFAGFLRAMRRYAHHIDSIAIGPLI
jgi:hypothetical protein